MIYLKDGSIFKGKIIERLPDGGIKLQTLSGRELIVSVKEIKQITIEGIGTNPADYGGKTAVGISLFGEGLAGAHFRLRANPKLFLDAGLQLQPILVTDRFNDEAELKGNITLGGELNYFLNRFYKERRQKIRANGIFFRGSHGFGKFDTSYFALGWCSEYFKLNRYKTGFLLNLGLALQINHWVDDPQNFNYTEDVREAMPTGYFRIQWNFHQ